MADNYLITGYWGEPHVTAENDRGINAAMFGAGRFVLPVGEQFKAEYIGNNTIRMYDGKLMDNGAAAGIPVGEYVDLLIANAGQGMKRNDLIVFQYKQDASTLIESGTFVVIQGTESSGTASDPALTQEDLLSGEAAFDQMALWRVPVSGTTISAPVKLFSVSKDIPGLKAWAEGAFAPTGYGLGGTNGKVVTDANNATNNGWYTIYNGGSNLPGTSFGGSIHVKAYPTGNIIQNLYYTGHGGGECRRICTDGTWGQWEFVTPPMYAGVEYRTTERYNGKAVYTKLLDCGTVTNGKAVNHGAGSGLIRMASVCSGILSTSINDQTDDWAWVVSADQTAVRMTCGSGIAGNASWKTQIWYTKD